MKTNRTMVKDLTPPPFTPGVYRHYKGWEYEALGVACHESELSWLVIYKPLYPHEHAPDIWARPYDDFCSTVEIDGKTVPRFELIKPA